MVSVLQHESAHNWCWLGLQTFKDTQRKRQEIIIWYSKLLSCLKGNVDNGRIKYATLYWHTDVHWNAVIIFLRVVVVDGDLTLEYVMN